MRHPGVLVGRGKQGRRRKGEHHTLGSSRWFWKSGTTLHVGIAGVSFFSFLLFFFVVLQIFFGEEEEKRVWSPDTIVTVASFFSSERSVRGVEHVGR